MSTNATNPRNLFLTGVSSGIGFGLAEFYLSAGWNVYGVSRRTPEALIGRDRFHFQTLDLTDSPAAMLQIPALLEGADRLDLVILNAGILGQIADMANVSIDQLRHLMDVNVWANKTILDILFGLQQPIEQIVTISSGAAVNGNRGWNGYAISKAALNMLTQLYAAENPNTHFSAVAPGLVDTAMQDHLCSLREQVSEFPSLGVLQSKRGSPEMPDPGTLAPRLAELIAQLPGWIDSGDFIDIRKPPSKNSSAGR